MDENLKTIIDSVILNEEISSQIQRKVLDSLVGLCDHQSGSRAEIKNYLTEQTKTHSVTTNQLAKNSLSYIK